LTAPVLLSRLTTRPTVVTIDACSTRCVARRPGRTTLDDDDRTNGRRTLVVRLVTHREARMKSFRKELWLNLPTRRGFVNLTPQVEECLR
jgi:hypothetical protein